MTALRWLSRYPLLVVLVPMIVYFQAVTSGFLTTNNVEGIALDGAILAIVAVPGALLLICGYLDLSVGSTLALGAVTAASCMINLHTTAAVALLAAIAAGAVVGLANGVICAVLGLSPFIVTLGTLTAIRGIDLLISPLPLNGFGSSFDALGSGRVLDIQTPVLIAAAILLLGAGFLGATPGGRYVFAIGVNREAAFLSGIAVRRLPLILYVTSGAAAGLAGAIQAARLDSAPAGSLGLQFELIVLTAVLLGGVAFTGGRGSILGVLLGVIFLGALQNGLTQLDVPDAWQQIVRGIALVAAAALALLRLPASLTRNLTGVRAEPPVMATKARAAAP